MTKTELIILLISKVIYQNGMNKSLCR